MSKWGDEGFSKEDEEQPNDDEDDQKKNSTVVTKKYGVKNKRKQVYMSEIDRKILAECDRSSTLYRGIPLMILGNLLYAYPQLKQGKRPSLLAVAAISCMGYLGGKLAYVGECKTQIVNSPSRSIFAEITRESLGLKARGSEDEEHQEPEPKARRRRT